jgi:hypothetical protein
MFRIVGQPPDLVGAADAGLRDLIEGCLVKSPEDRLTVPNILAALTNRGLAPATLAPRVPRVAAPPAFGLDTQTRTYPPSKTPTQTDPVRNALSAPLMVPPGTALPPRPLRARHSDGRPRRRPAALIATVAAVVVLAAVIPVLLTTGPGTASGHGRSPGPSSGTADSGGREQELAFTLMCSLTDEAHMLEPGQLEAIRMLTNHDLDSACPLACLLIGQPTLRRQIKLGILADQRIAVRYTMPGMTSQETTSYIGHHLTLAGRFDPLFSDDATALIHASSRGLPRAVDNLAIQALIAAYATRKAIVDETSARAAATEVTSD